MFARTCLVSAEGEVQGAAHVAPTKVLGGPDVNHQQTGPNGRHHANRVINYHSFIS